MAKRSNLKKQSLAEKIFDCSNIIFMILFAALCLFPFINVMALSFNTGTDAMRGGIYFWPRDWTIQNYTKLLSDDRISRALIISVSRTVLTTTLVVLLNSCFAYALAKKDLPGRRILNWMVFIPMYFGGGLIPYFLICRMLGLINNFLVYVVPCLYSSFYILMLRVYYMSMESSLEDSARIDGAGYFDVFFRIYFPLSVPSLATVAILEGVGQWNSWYDGFIMVNDSRLWPLQTLLLHIIQGSQAMMEFFKDRNLAIVGSLAKRVSYTPESLKMAMVMVAILPIIFIYPFLQKYFIKGIMIGSIKG